VKMSGTNKIANGCEQYINLCGSTLLGLERGAWKGRSPIKFKVKKLKIKAKRAFRTKSLFLCFLDRKKAGLGNPKPVNF